MPDADALEHLKELVGSVKPDGDLRVGRLLDTKQTRGWSDDRKRMFQAIEERLVFVSFTEDDEGRSRFQVAQCCSAEWAVFFVRAVEIMRRLAEPGMEERVARVIDPGALWEHTGIPGFPLAEAFQERQRLVLAKARAVLALLINGEGA